MWVDQIEVLRRHFRVLAIDLPGHGHSVGLDHELSLEETAEAIVMALEELGVTRFGYAGHSMGGMVGMRLALAYPERVQALALCNTSAREQEQPLKDLFHQVNEDSRGKPSAPSTVNFVMSLMFSESYLKSSPERTAPFESLLYEPTDAEGVYWVARAVIWRTNVLEDLTEIESPTLVVTSHGDRSIPAEHGIEMARAIPGADLLDLADAGHLTPVECAPEMTQALLNHFRTHLQGSES
jgi:pimeloyl-ACP methyl ester carboxylesterase